MFPNLALTVLLAAGLPHAAGRVFEIRTHTTSQPMERLQALFRDHSLALFSKLEFPSPR